MDISHNRGRTILGFDAVERDCLVTAVGSALVWAAAGDTINGHPLDVDESQKMLNFVMTLSPESTTLTVKDTESYIITDSLTAYIEKTNGERAAKATEILDAIHTNFRERQLRNAKKLKPQVGLTLIQGGKQNTT